MIQPDAGESVLRDPRIRDQGLLSRFLIAYPESRIGTRLIQGNGNSSQLSQGPRQPEIALTAYDARVTELLEGAAQTTEDPRELKPRSLALSDEARTILVDFANSVELAQAKGGEFEGVRGSASKAAEQAARIAGVMTLFQDVDAETVSTEIMVAATKLMTWYMNEAKRLLDTGKISDETREAEVLRTWICHQWSEDFIDVRTIVRLGPNRLRDTNRIRRLIPILEKNGWLMPLPDGATVADSPARVAWKIARA